MTRAHSLCLIRLDMPEVLAIENEAFEFRWSEDDFHRQLQQRNTIGMVAESRVGLGAGKHAEQGDVVVGFMVYDLEIRSLRVTDFAVAHAWRRKGVGRQMVDKLKAKLTATKRSRIELVVRERNVAAQLFWRANGFQAVEIVRDYYDDTAEDGYRFEWFAGLDADKHVEPLAGLGAGKHVEPNAGDKKTSPKPIFHNRLAGRFKEDANDVGFE